MSRWFRLSVVLIVASCQQQACPSSPGKDCDPRSANCPVGYHCALAEICTRTCEQTSDCWLKVETGCRVTCTPGQRLADGGTCREDTGVEFCPESLEVACVGGYCQLATCLDGGCDYDVYGPSGNKGNRSQGP